MDLLYDMDSKQLFDTFLKNQNCQKAFNIGN